MQFICLLLTKTSLWLLTVEKDFFRKQFSRSRYFSSHFSWDFLHFIALSQISFTLSNLLVVKKFHVFCRKVFLARNTRGENNKKHTKKGNLQITFLLLEFYVENRLWLKYVENGFCSPINQLQKLFKNSQHCRSWKCPSA